MPQWEIVQKHKPEEINSFSQKLNVPPIIAKILLDRGIDTFEKAKRFFRPRTEYLYDPFLMKDMDRAVERVLRALKRGERILIYGDYDVDGTTSVSMLYLFLKELGGDVYFYIPDRIREGYGLSEIGIRAAHKLGVKLIISVDCGVTALKEAELAKELGIDLIISDHHEVRERLPDAFALLDPKREDCDYPFKELAGVGVAYKLLQAISRELGCEQQTLEEYIDLVAMGSAADIVPIIDENRILVKNGLEKLHDSDKLGLQALIETSGLKGTEIGTGQVVFILAPRINAVGRLGSAERAVRLLTTKNEQQAKNIARILEAENRNRRNIDEETLKQAVDMIEKKFDPEENWIFVLALEGWHPGVIGIVASRIVERYYRPTIMIALEEGVGRGSARSIPGFDIYRALRESEDLLMGFGGHKYAAGLSIEEDKIDPLRERLNQVARRVLTQDQLIPKLRIDGELDFDQITPRFLKILKLFAPYGPQNMRPVFLSRNLQVVGTPQVVGNNHLKFKVRQKGVVMEAIGFDLGDMIERLSPGKTYLDMAYVIDENKFQGMITIQLRIKDLRWCDEPSGEGSAQNWRASGPQDYIY